MFVNVTDTSQFCTSIAGHQGMHGLCSGKRSIYIKHVEHRLPAFKTQAGRCFSLLETYDITRFEVIMTGPPLIPLLIARTGLSRINIITIIILIITIIVIIIIIIIIVTQLTINDYIRQDTFERHSDIFRLFPFE